MGSMYKEKINHMPIKKYVPQKGLYVQLKDQPCAKRKYVPKATENHRTYEIAQMSEWK